MKFLTPIFILLLTVFLSSAVSAQTPTTSLLQKNARTMVAPQPGTTTGGTLQTKSIAEIDRRIAALNASLTTLNSIKFLSATEKTVITQKIQNELTQLTAIKQKITANTDPLMLKNDVASVSASHRTFAFIYPQVRILAAADLLNATANMLFDFAEKLEARITEAKTAGNNTTRLESQLATMKQQITTAQTLTTSIMSSASSATAEGTVGKTALTAAARNIKQAAASLRAALQTGNQIRTALAQMTPVTPETPVGSASANPAVQRPISTPNAY